MNYVIAAWVACTVIIVVYVARTLRRERELRRCLSPREPSVPSGGSAKWH